ncbi:MAG: 4-hydroxythreonine-4-phosphate dehydrogenase PdxA [Prevotella sp.]|jgi:4-hydroxythreonine-4-phosphate dehydrogenase|nr:4-hydroxythreonine-4-phosphate dehydrogenase PdxA [Prevotella sp.]
MEEKKIRVAITHGDTNGIGYEIILKAFEDPMMFELCTPIIYGNPKVATYHRNVMKLDTPFSIIGKAEDARDGRLNLLAVFDEEVKVELGTPTADSAEAARKALQRAKEDLKQNLYDVLVQAPVVSSNTPDREDRSLLVMFADDIRIALVTSRLPLKEVAQSITQENIVEKATLFHTSLRRDFRISNPRIAILALNPQPGTEEKDVIAPAIEALEKESIQAYGPFTADDFFGKQKQYGFDGILAMYDDQGNVPFKTLATEFGVKMKTGFPFVITTPDHGPAFDIAGKGEADPASLRHAIYAAIDILRNRKEYDDPKKNPLPKLYHEKREDGEKVRFISKKPEQE